MSDWSAELLSRHLSGTEDIDRPCVFAETTNAESRQSAASDAVREILSRTGLNNDTSVKQSSVRGWLARSIYDETHDLFIVAHRLGLRRLDNVSELLGLSLLSADVAPQHRIGGVA